MNGDETRKKIATAQSCAIATPQVGQHNKAKSRQGVAASCHAGLGRPPLAMLNIGCQGPVT